MRRSISVPGRKPVPILGWRGNVLRYFRNPIAYLMDLHQRYGDVVCLVEGGNQPIVFRPAATKTNTIPPNNP